MYAVDSLTHTHAHLAQTAGGLPAVKEDEAEMSTAHGGHAHKRPSATRANKVAAAAATRLSGEQQSSGGAAATGRVQYPVATLMLECRQDLIVQKQWRTQVMDILQEFIENEGSAAGQQQLTSAR